jgi:hypothetical protein
LGRFRIPLGEFQDYRWTIAGIAAFLAAYLLINAFKFLPTEVSSIFGEIFLTLCVVLLIHVLDHMVFSKGWRRQLLEQKQQSMTETMRLFKPVSEDAKASLRSLADASLSFAAMHGGGMTRIYRNRSEASLDMAQDLTAPDVTKIRILGISLNDFVLDNRDKLYIAFGMIQDALRRDKKNRDQKSNDKASAANANGSALDVKLLILDPCSYGAQQRYKAETQLPNAPRSRLKHDVETVADKLIEFKKEILQQAERCIGEKPQMQFDVRVYRTTPQLFLAWTDRCCYLQQYFFWKSRAAEGAVPVFRFQPIKSDPRAMADKFEPPKLNMHEEIESHFDWIWDKASISLEEFCHDHVVGCDMGLSQADATNVFMDPQTSRERIISLLRSVKEGSQVDLLGISLHSYFGRGQPIAKELLEKVFRTPGVTVRVLCIDPNCEQAKIRSYREVMLPDLELDKVNASDFTRYAEKGSIDSAESDLSRHTQQTLANLSELLKSNAVKCKLEAWKYKCAPTCFMLRVDERALFEPYTYGKLDRSSKSRTLGGDMPLFEFIEPKDDQDRLFDKVDNRNPVGLLKDHFDFIAKISEPLGTTAPAAEQVVSEHHRAAPEEPAPASNGGASVGPLNFDAKGIEQVPPNATGVFWLEDAEGKMLFKGAVHAGGSLAFQLRENLDKGGPLQSSAARFYYEVIESAEEIFRREHELTLKMRVQRGETEGPDYFD